MNNTQLILATCQQLHAEGKKPSIAMVRNKLPGNIALAEVISVVQKFKANPALKSSPDTSSLQQQDQQPLSDQQRITKLETQVEALQQQLQGILQRLK